jgi:hypothetical protein
MTLKIAGNWARQWLKKLKNKMMGRGFSLMNADKTENS